MPAAWDAKGCGIMREAAITAGLVQSARAGDRDWRDRLRIIRFGAQFISWRLLMRLSDTILPSHEYSEPEAAAVHCAHLTNLHQLKPSQNFMICDAGGGTVVCVTLTSSPLRAYLLSHLRVLYTSIHLLKHVCVGAGLGCISDHRSTSSS